MTMTGLVRILSVLMSRTQLNPCSTNHTAIATRLRKKEELCILDGWTEFSLRHLPGIEKQEL
jgi:hypothetical protein